MCVHGCAEGWVVTADTISLVAKGIFRFSAVFYVSFAVFKEIFAFHLYVSNLLASDCLQAMKGLLHVTGIFCVLIVAVHLSRLI